MNTNTATLPPSPSTSAADRAQRAKDHQRAFHGLTRRIKDAGLLQRRAGRYLVRGLILAAGFAVAVTLLATLGPTPWQLAVAALFGILFTQAAFLAHDAAHQQVFNSAQRNEWLSTLVANLVLGVSHTWWARKHGKHHANPNVIGKDGDIRTGALVYNPDDMTGRRGGLVGWLTRRQGWLFFPMLTLLGLNMHRNAVRTVLFDPELPHRGREAILMGIRLIGFPVLVVMLLGPWLGLGFVLVQVMVFGFYMGACFAPNHKGMPLISERTTVDFFRRQVLTSRNIRGGWLVHWAMGGLNYQIEHHLFPRMPSANLRRAQEIVRAFCDEHRVHYTETSLTGAYRVVVQYLNRVGMGHSDPFDCPLAAQLRPV